MKTIYDHFEQRVEEDASRVAVHFRGENVTYGQIASRADALAGWFEQQGIKRGDRVALLLANSPDYVACYLGILRSGAAVVALNPETTAHELAHTLADAAPAAVIASAKALTPLGQVAEQLPNVRALLLCDSQAAPTVPHDWHVAELAQVLQLSTRCSGARPRKADLAQIIYTSGTTGRPKGVMLSHGNISANCESILSYLQLTAADSIFVTLPFFYSYGNSLLFTHLAVGGRMVLASDFVFWNRALDLMQRQQVTGFSGVPSSYAMLLHKSDFARREFPDLRYLTCAGGGLAPAVAEKLQETLPHVQLFLMYGQTEATARLSTLMPNEVATRLGSIGRGIPGVTLRVLDEGGQPVPPGEMGEIVAQGENLMVGYWNDPEATHHVLRDEGLWTGDLAHTDDDGYIYIVGRRSDIIKSGAYRINPKEIEEVILGVEGVAEVAVVGMADSILGESPVAFLVPSRSAPPTADQIYEHCRRHLPRYKLVRDVQFVESLPKTSSGKIKRTELVGAGR